MAAHVPFPRVVRKLCALSLALASAPLPFAAQESAVPQTALSTCAALSFVSREDVPPGTAIAVSPDGRWLARYVHTTRGDAELRLRNRDTGEQRAVSLQPPALPPGIAWRVFEAVFSPTGDVLVVRSTGATWVFATEDLRPLFSLGEDHEKQTFPGKFTLAAGQMTVLFWPPESYLADAETRAPVEARFYDAHGGQVLRSLSLKIEASNQWSDLALSPDATRLAVLERATRWPGKGHVYLYAADSGKLFWEKKIGAETLAWSADGRSLAVLGSELVWLNAASGKELRHAEKRVRFSEYQTLRWSEPAGVVLGQFARFNPFKRGLDLRDQRQARLLLWRADTGKPLCDRMLEDAIGVDAWLTARGELVTLEENYEVRPQLRLLRSAHIVTYRIEKP